MKKFIAATALVTTLGVAGTTVAGTAAFANDGTDGHRQKNDQEVRSNRHDRRHATDPANDIAKDTAVKNVAELRLKARHDHKGWVLGRRWLIQTSADAIGIDASALRAQLRAGQSIAEVAAANGVDPATVVTALVKPLSTRIDAAVAKGKFSADKAATMEAAFVERVTKLINAKKTTPAPATAAPTS